MTKQEYLKLRFEKPRQFSKIIRSLKIYEKIKLYNTQYNFGDISISQQCYNYFFNITEIPRCKVCRKKVSFGGNKRLGYAIYCSRKCTGKDNKYKGFRIKGHKPNNVVSDKEIFEIKYSEIKNIKLKVQEILLLLDIPNLKYSLFKKNPNLLRAIYEYPGNTLIEKCYIIINDLKEIPKCKVCGIKNQNFNGLKNGYSGVCSKSCGTINKENIKRIKDRNNNYKNYKNDIEEKKIFKVLTNKEEYVNTGYFNIKHNKCGNIFRLNYISNRKNFSCPKCFTKSNFEEEVCFFIHSLNIETINNTKPIKDFTQSGNKGNLEIDILIPSYNLGIECDGIYYHTELSGSKDRNYHLWKTEQAKEQLGIDLIHIFDSEWNNKQDIIKSIIKNKLGKTPNKIYARKCIIKEVKRKEKNDFLNNNHLQGKDNSSIRLGLYYDNKLVSLMTFGSRRITGKTSFELIRFCNLINTNVIGSASRLFKHFLNNFWKNQEIITYADKRFSIGKLYYKLGFKYSHESLPNYWYTKNYIELEHRANYMKHKLKNKSENFDVNLTEWENMQQNGYDRIWDCGNFIFKYNS